MESFSHSLSRVLFPDDLSQCPIDKTERKLTNTVNSRLMGDLAEKKRHNTTIPPLPSHMYAHTCVPAHICAQSGRNSESLRRP